ncbi:MAG TPA: HAD-IA family hydrolase [Chthoniobacterales bacterium]
MRQFQVATFDAVGTLIELVQPPGFTYAEVARESNLNWDGPRLQQAFRQAWRETPPPADASGPRPDDDRSWWHELVRRTLERAGYTPPCFDTYFDRVYQRFEHPAIWRPKSQVPEVLTHLAGTGLRLGVLSNFDRRLHRVLAHLDLARFFEHVIISSEVGANKPSPLIFQAALARFSVPPAGMVHVGDDASLDGAAAALGIAAFIVGRQTLRELPAYVGRPLKEGRVT